MSEKNFSVMRVVTKIRPNTKNINIKQFENSDISSMSDFIYNRLNVKRSNEKQK